MIIFKNNIDFFSLLLWDQFYQGITYYFFFEIDFNKVHSSFMKMKALTYNYANINRISKYDSLISKDLDRWISKDGVLFVGMMWFESSYFSKKSSKNIQIRHWSRWWSFSIPSLIKNECRIREPFGYRDTCWYINMRVVGV